MKKNKLLVTGVAGYIGSTFTYEALKKGYEVVGVDNFCNSDDAIVNNFLRNHADQFQFVELDLQNKAELNSVLRQHKDIDCVLHFAALKSVPESEEKFDLYWKNNVENTTRMQKICGYNNIPLLYASSSCIHNWWLSPYGTTKKVNEETAMPNQVALRFTTVYGDGARENMFIPKLLNHQVKYVTRHIRDFIHVKDVCRAFIHAIENFESMKNQAYNVGLSSANLSKMDLCKKIKEFVPGFEIYESEHGEDPDKRDYVVSNDKIEATGYSPKYDLDYGIPELLKLYKLMKTYQHGNV